MWPAMMFAKRRMHSEMHLASMPNTSMTNSIGHSAQRHAAGHDVLDVGDRALLLDARELDQA